MAKKTRSYHENFAYYAYYAYSTSFDWFLTSALVDDCQSSIIYDRSEQAQVLYVIPVTSILGRLPVVPVGEKGTIPLTCEENQQTFLELSVIEARTVRMDVGGGT